VRSKKLLQLDLHQLDLDLGVVEMEVARDQGLEMAKEAQGDHDVPVCPREWEGQCRLREVDRDLGQCRPREVDPDLGQCRPQEVDQDQGQCRPREADQDQDQHHLPAVDLDQVHLDKRSFPGFLE